jgi:SAM-dependent methyltransferase
MIIYDYLHETATPTDRILDVGCKDGQYLTGCDGEIIALDIKVDPVHDDLTYVTADGTRMPFNTDTFDYVVTNQVLEHIPNNRKAPFIAEISRVLKIDGELLLSFPNRLWPGNPHQLPAGYSLLPREVGLELSALLAEDQANYYRDHVFNISPLAVRKLLSRFFEETNYATLDILQETKELSKQSWSRMKLVVDAFAPMFQVEVFRSCFELAFPYSAYRCTHPKESAKTL